MWVVEWEVEGETAQRVLIEGSGGGYLLGDADAAGPGDEADDPLRWVEDRTVQVDVQLFARLLQAEKREAVAVLAGGFPVVLVVVFQECDCILALREMVDHVAELNGQLEEDVWSRDGVVHDLARQSEDGNTGVVWWILTTRVWLKTQEEEEEEA